jgi:hypothetical protein
MVDASHPDASIIVQLKRLSLTAQLNGQGILYSFNRLINPQIGNGRLMKPISRCEHNGAKLVIGKERDRTDDSRMTRRNGLPPNIQTNMTIA